MTILQETAILCKNIKTLRLANGVSQKEMSKICGCAISTLRKLENGELPQKLKVDIIFKLSQYFNIKPKELFLPLKPPYNGYNHYK